MTRWLTEEEQLAWRRYLQASSLLSERLDDGLQQRSGLASTDYEILVMLSETPDHRLRMSDLAEHVLISRSRLTYRVDQLVKRGFVSREICDTDGRGMNAALTDDGLAALRDAAPGHVEDVRHLLIDRIDPADLQRFSELFARVTAAVMAPPSVSSDEPRAARQPGTPKRSSPIGRATSSSLPDVASTATLGVGPAVSSIGASRR